VGEKGWVGGVYDTATLMSCYVVGYVVGGII
jgi:hypothetical protein